MYDEIELILDTEFAEDLFKVLDKILEDDSKHSVLSINEFNLLSDFTQTLRFKICS